MNKLLFRGQITILSAIVGASGMVFASALTAWATANNSIASVKENVSVVTERENNHYVEIQRQLSEINGKLDTLLLQRPLTFKP